MQSTYQDIKKNVSFEIELNKTIEVHLRKMIKY